MTFRPDISHGVVQFEKQPEKHVEKCLPFQHKTHRTASKTWSQHDGPGRPRCGEFMLFIDLSIKLNLMKRWTPNFPCKDSWWERNCFGKVTDCQIAVKHPACPKPVRCESFLNNFLWRPVFSWKIDLETEKKIRTELSSNHHSCAQILSFCLDSGFPG